MLQCSIVKDKPFMGDYVEVVLDALRCLKSLKLCLLSSICRNSQQIHMLAYLAVDICAPLMF